MSQAAHFALTRFTGLSPAFNAKQDALRSFSEGGLVMYYVYLLESESTPGRRYVGLSSDLKQRFHDHNSDKSPHTAKYKPWRLVTYVAFSNRSKAEEFERYLKSTAAINLEKTGDTLKFFPDDVVDGIAAAALEEDRPAQQRP
jgi:putative endonuclease